MTSGSNVQNTASCHGWFNAYPLTFGSFLGDTKRATHAKLQRQFLDFNIQPTAQGHSG